jgi:hypothetical protein
MSSEILQDDMAAQLACVVAAANQRAIELDLDLRQCLVSVTPATLENPHWRINYGPKDYLNRRGGDVIIDVDPNDVSVKRVLRGQ